MQNLSIKLNFKLNQNLKLIQLHPVSRKQHGRHRVSCVKTLRSSLSAEFFEALQSGGTRRQVFVLLLLLIIFFYKL